MALQCGSHASTSRAACRQHSMRLSSRVHAAAPSRPRRGQAVRVLATATSTQQDSGSRTIVQKNTPGEMPFPWSEKDPYRLPVAIERVQQQLVAKGWEKAWVEQIVDRIMKGMLKTTEERAMAVMDFLSSLGLGQDQICNMASISVVLLGLNPDTRLAPVVEYLKARGVPADQVGRLVLQHPRIFEYKVTEDGMALAKGKARIQVDVVPLPNGGKAAGVNYFREGASFLASPVSPMPPMPSMGS